jgi:tRNA (cmo5U34)-methyltransferase
MLSELVLKSYPQAKVLVFDLTHEMLEACKQRLAAFEGRVDFKQGDFRTDSFGVSYDVILAGLTLHHLDPEGRQEIYVRLYGALKNPGVFLAREVFVDDDPFVAEWHYSLWRSFMRANGEDDEFWFGKHRMKDHPVSVEQQSAWLRKAGFVHTACHWRYWNFAIVGGHKV